MFLIRELWRRLSDVIALFCEELLEAENEPF